MSSTTIPDVQHSALECLGWTFRTVRGVVMPQVSHIFLGLLPPRVKLTTPTIVQTDGSTSRNAAIRILHKHVEVDGCTNFAAIHLLLYGCTNFLARYSSRSTVSGRTRVGFQATSAALPSVIATAMPIRARASGGWNVIAELGQALL